jgi:hypothetical protein
MENLELGVGNTLYTQKIDHAPQRWLFSTKAYCKSDQKFLACRLLKCTQYLSVSLDTSIPTLLDVACCLLCDQRKVLGWERVWDNY